MLVTAAVLRWEMSNQDGCGVDLGLTRFRKSPSRSRLAPEAQRSQRRCFGPAATSLMRPMPAGKEVR